MIQQTGCEIRFRQLSTAQSVLNKRDSTDAEFRMEHNYNKYTNRTSRHGGYQSYRDYKRADRMEYDAFYEEMLKKNSQIKRDNIEFDYQGRKNNMNFRFLIWFILFMFLNTFVIAKLTNNRFDSSGPLLADVILFQELISDMLVSKNLTLEIVLSEYKHYYSPIHLHKYDYGPRLRSLTFEDIVYIDHVLKLLHPRFRHYLMNKTGDLVAIYNDPNYENFKQNYKKIRK